MSDSRKIAGFKRFSDIKESKSDMEEVSINGRSATDSDIPGNPNLPTEADQKKIEKPISRKGILPQEQNIDLPTGEDNEFDEKVSDTKESRVETIGKVAKFPKNTKASKAYNFLENVKVSKKSIWYIMVEKQENELQMVKYNFKEGVDLGKFVNELKTYYIKKYSNEPKVCELIESIKVDGNDKYSMIKDIPLVTIEGRKMISIITEDLIKLLSK
jgi:hypothetical protein